MIEEQLLRRDVKRFRGGLVFKAHRLVYHSTLAWRVIKKKKKGEGFTLRMWCRLESTDLHLHSAGLRVEGLGLRVEG